MNLTDRFTLMVPTYNRPGDLARLLRYLAHHSVAFPILVLDSGDDASKTANAALVSEVDLNIRLIAYESSMAPWEKFWRGSDEVKTEFCSLCADDDILMTDSLPPLVEFLHHHPDFSAAHGWYFTFYNSVHLGITSVVYAGPSLDQDDPLRRLRDMFSRYEAVTYAVYRAGIMQKALRAVQPVGSLMLRELLAGAVTVVSGKAARLPLLYYGRALGGSQLYDHWHPIDFMISSPEQMFAQYAKYRQILFECFQDSGYNAYSPADLRKLIDLIHMRYLSEYVSPGMMNYLIDEVMGGTDRKEIMQGVWPRLTPSAAPRLNVLRRSRLLRKIRDRFVPGFRLYHLYQFLGAVEDQTVTTTTVGGHPREYRLYRGFLASVAQAGRSGRDNLVDGVIRALNAYE